MSSKWREKGFFGTAKLAPKFEDLCSLNTVNHKGEFHLEIVLKNDDLLFCVLDFSEMYDICSHLSGHSIHNLCLNNSKIHENKVFHWKIFAIIIFLKAFYNIILYKCNCWCGSIEGKKKTPVKHSRKYVCGILRLWKACQNLWILATRNGWIFEWDFCILDHSVSQQ